MNYSNDLIVLFNILKGYNDDIREIITSDDENKNFSNEDLDILMENIMCDLKDLRRKVISDVLN